MTDTEKWLKSLGFEKPKDFIEEEQTYKCDVCKDTGYYSVQPDNKGMASVIYECSCLAKIKSKRYAEISGLGELLNKRVNTFDATLTHQKEMKQLATDYLVSGSKDWFVLLGQSGSGKTHLASAIANKLIDNGLETQYIIWTSFTNEMNVAMFKENDHYALDRFKKVPVLYIDDFFKGRLTEYNITMAFDLINYRTNNKLITIISSELTLNDIREIDNAVAGRVKQNAGKYLYEVKKGKDKDYRMRGM